MVYDWKVKGLYPVAAQDAGEELERIYDEHGKIEPAEVVNESRPETAVLHPCFEWRDDVAAEKYREEQARGICRCIVVTKEEKGKEPIEVRAIMNVQGEYHPTQVIIQHEDKYNALYQSALRELESFKKKFYILSDIERLKYVFDAIDNLLY